MILKKKLANKYHLKIIRESVITMTTKQGGCAIKYAHLRQNGFDAKLEQPAGIWENDVNEDGHTMVCFRPVTDRSVIPFYDMVTKQPYHNGLTAEDEQAIRDYTGDGYKILNTKCYTLKLDDEYLPIAKKLFSACYAAVQTDLPFKVYHFCKMTEKSFDWWQVGMTFYTPAFVSASRNPYLKWPGNCRWEILLSKGQRHHVVDVRNISLHPNEQEILISCCTRFRILEKNRTGENFYLKLQYLDL